MMRTRCSMLWLLGALVQACGSSSPAQPTPTPSASPTPILPEPAGWQLLANSPLSPAQNRHDDVFFLTRGLGWLVNTRGEIYKTLNGGDTWSLVHADPTTFFRTVGFASEALGWVGNFNLSNNPEPGRALYESRDGGDTWSNITGRVRGREPVGLCGIWVVDADTIFAVGRWNGPAVIVRSLDGGRSWTSRDMAPLATGLVDVYFFDRRRGLAVGGVGVGNSEAEQRASRTVVLGTVDGGDSWQVRHLSSQAGEWAWKISFPTRSIGYVATQGSAGTGVVLKTTDAGLSWRELVVGRGLGFSGIGFATADLGWVSGVDTYETRDGGANWRPVGLGENLNRFRMSPSVGYASGRQVHRFSPGAASQ